MIELVDVDDEVLDRLVEAAVSDADADEVTPPAADGSSGWTHGRVVWLREYHRRCRGGLRTGREATWAIVVDGSVVGSIRLARVDGADADLAETGVWLTRGARGQGVGGQALAAVLGRARSAGVATVRADTSEHNAAALSILRGAGFATADAGDGRVAATCRLAP